MKTIFRIILILAVAAIVASGFYLAVNRTSTTSAGQPTAFNGNNGQFPSGTRPEGGRGGEGGGDFGGLFVTLVKLAGITVVVLFFQKLLQRGRAPLHA